MIYSIFNKTKKREKTLVNFEISLFSLKLKIIDILFIMKKELDLKFACRRSEWHASIGDIMIPVNIKDLPEPEQNFYEY